jgi:hypothetical protein
MTARPLGAVGRCVSGTHSDASQGLRNTCFPCASQPRFWEAETRISPRRYWASAKPVRVTPESGHRTLMSTRPRPGGSHLVYSRRRGVKSQLFCSAQAIILRTFAIWALARFMLTAGWIDNYNAKYSCIGAFHLALLCALRVVNEHKCLWNVRHDLIIPRNDLLKSSPLVPGIFVSR